MTQIMSKSDVCHMMAKKRTLRWPVLSKFNLERKVQSPSGIVTQCPSENECIVRGLLAPGAGIIGIIDVIGRLT